LLALNIPLQLVASRSAEITQLKLKVKIL